MAASRWMKWELVYILRIEEVEGEIGHGLERQYNDSNVVWDTEPSLYPSVLLGANGSEIFN